MDLASLYLFSELLASSLLRGTSLYRGLDLLLSALVDLSMSAHSRSTANHLE